MFTEEQASSSEAGSHATSINILPTSQWQRARVVPRVNFHPLRSCGPHFRAHANRAGGPNATKNACPAAMV
jgi:hypothetical protein